MNLANVAEWTKERIQTQTPKPLTVNLQGKSLQAFFVKLEDNKVLTNCKNDKGHIVGHMWWTLDNYLDMLNRQPRIIIQQL